MKIFNPINNIFIVIFMMICMTSCNYLDVVPPETADIKDMMKDEEAAINFLYSCYDGVWSFVYQTNRNYENSVDEFACPILWNLDSQKTSWNLLSSFSQTYPWNKCYGNLGQCHQFLKSLNESTPVGVTNEDRVRWTAEINFLQAYYHFVLLESYGPIPIVNKYYSMNTAKTDFPGRSHFDCCVDSIVSWLDMAADNLPAKVSDISELSRATSTICKALKARVLLYAASPLWNGSFPYTDWKNSNYETPGYGKELVSHQYDVKKWERALTACKEALEWATAKGDRQLFSVTSSELIRQNQSVPLPTIANVDDNFKQHVMLMRYLMTTKESEGNKEVIWGAGNPGDDEVIRVMLPHAITYYNGSPTGGYSGMSPYLSSIEKFYTKDGKLPKYDENFTDQSEWFNSAGISGRSNVINLCAGREPRFYAWLGYDGGEYSSQISNGSPLVIQARNSKAQGFNPDLYNRDNSVTGFFDKKRVQPNLNKRASDNGWNWSYSPWPIIRLAECYLNLAECYAALAGQNSSYVQLALDNLNVVRERAGIPDLTTNDITSDMTLMDWVRSERFIELWGEGTRYYDVRRWMIAPQVLKAGAREGLNALGKTDPSFMEFNQRTKVDQPFEWSNRMYLLPINIDEIYSNPQLVQAPEY